MSTEDDSQFITVKEEVNSDNEDQKLQNSSLNHYLDATLSNSTRNKIEVQVLSYLDIKEEPDSENEDLNNCKDVREDYTVNNEGYYCNSQELPQNSYKNPQIKLKSSKNMQSSRIGSFNLSRSDSNLDQIVKIKEEDDFEFKIVELSSISDDYLDYNQLESIVEFEDEQKTTFRIEELDSYDRIEDEGSGHQNLSPEDQILKDEGPKDQQLKDPATKDITNSQNKSLNQFSRNLNSSQVSKADGNPKLTQLILNKAQNRLKLEERNLVLQASNFHLRKGLSYNTKQNSLNLPIKKELDDSDHQTPVQSLNSTKSDKNLTSTSGFVLNASSSLLLDTPTTSTSTTIQQNSPKILFLQNQIFQDSLKIFRKSMKFSEPCYQKYSSLSNSLQKLSLNNLLLSRILLKNPTNLPPQQMAPKMQIISKSIRFDKSDLPELPKDVMEKFSIRKQSVNFEKKEGQVINMFNIPYYVCTTCLTIFATQNEFFKHYKVLHATVDKPFDCWKCVTSFCTWKELLTHLKCHDDNRMFSCKFCFFSYKFKETLEKHLRTVHGEKVEKISCEICGWNFDNEKDMLTHRNRHAGVGKIVKIGDVRSSHGASIKCIFCPAKFFKNEALEEHYKSHKALERMKCRGCSKEVMINPQFIIRNIKMREFKCINCAPLISNGTASKSLTIADGLVKIEKSDEHEVVTEVSTVDIKVKEPKRMMIVNKNRESMKVSVKCYVCGLEVGSNIKLFWHMKKHLEKNEFKCSICRKDFSSRESMVEHSNTEHPTTSTTKCKICDKEFHFVDLDTHMRTHMETLEEPASINPSSLHQGSFSQPKMIRLNSKGEAISLNGVGIPNLINENLKNESWNKGTKIILKRKPVGSNGRPDKRIKLEKLS